MARSLPSQSVNVNTVSDATLARLEALLVKLKAAGAVKTETAQAARAAAKAYARIRRQTFREHDRADLLDAYKLAVGEFNTEEKDALGL
jgi:hypothetical protein